MIHIFFAERAVARVPGIPKDTKTYPIANVGIIGAGTMGGGIAMACANAGISVLLKETEQAALDRGMAAIRKNYESSVKKGRFSQAVMEQRMALIHPQTYLRRIREGRPHYRSRVREHAAQEADLRRNRQDRQAGLRAGFQYLDARYRRDRRGDFAPADGDRPAFLQPRERDAAGGDRARKAPRNEVVATSLAIAKKLGKVGVVVGNCRGFVGNRMMLPYMREAQFLVEEGATPEQVDKALTDFGMAMGIFAVDDMGGIDLACRVKQEYAYLRKPGERVPLVLDKLYEMGRLGQKRGMGWYRYDETRAPIADPEVHALIEKTANEAGIARRAITPEEIIERCIYVMINEGARILEEGHAQRAADIDVIYCTGYGFPGYRGGPMWYADTVGLKNVYARVHDFHKEYGHLWEPAPLLKKLAEEGGSFADWDAAREK